MSNALDFLLDPAPEPADTYRWATVTGIGPLRIRLDGEAEPLAATPAAICPLQLGDRVWVQIHGRQMVVLGAHQVPA